MFSQEEWRGLLVKARDEFQGVRAEVAHHVFEISGGRQVADLSPLEVGRNAVITSSLDVDGKQIESPGHVARLEQVIGHLSGERGVQRSWIVAGAASNQRVDFAISPQRERVEHCPLKLQVSGRSAASLLDSNLSLFTQKEMVQSTINWPSVCYVNKVCVMCRVQRLTKT